MSGVRQGSYLGLFLFILNINDLPSVVNSSHILIYDCDAKLFPSFTLEDHSYLHQSDLDDLVT